MRQHGIGTITGCDNPNTVQGKLIASSIRKDLMHDLKASSCKYTVCWDGGLVQSISIASGEDMLYAVEVANRTFDRVNLRTFARTKRTGMLIIRF